MTDDERMRRRLERAGLRLMRTLARSPKAARELLENKQAAKGEPIAFPPSRFNLGPRLEVRSEAFKRTDLCTEAELRQAEAVAFGLNTPGHAGLIAFYRHTRYGCPHPDGYAGELGFVSMSSPDDVDRTPPF